MAIKKENLEITFHDLLNSVSSVRNIFYLLLMGKNYSDKKKIVYLKDGLKRSNQLIKNLQSLRQKLIP